MSRFARAGSRTSTVTVGIAFAVAAAASLATAGFIANELVDEGTPGVVVAFYETVFGLAYVTAAYARRLRGSRLGFERGAVVWVFIAGFSLALGVGSFYTALGRIDYSVGAPIVGAAPLVSYLGVLIFLRGHERITPRMLLGAAMVVAGVGMIGVGS